MCKNHEMDEETEVLGLDGGELGEWNRVIERETTLGVFE